MLCWRCGGASFVQPVVKSNAAARIQILICHVSNVDLSLFKQSAV
jgi:hypothetical protein